MGNKDIFSKNLKREMLLKGKAASEICKDLGLKHNSFSDWYNAKTYPRIDKIEMLANYFGCKKSDLIEDKTNFDYSTYNGTIINKINNEIVEWDDKKLVSLLAFIKSMNGGDKDEN